MITISPDDSAAGPDHIVLSARDICHSTNPTHPTPPHSLGQHLRPRHCLPMAGLELSDFNIGLAGRFRNSVAGHAGHAQSDGGGQVDSMSDADEERADAVARPEHHTDLLP